MRKPLVDGGRRRAAMFVIIAVGLVLLTLFQHDHSGIRAVAGGVSEASASLVHLLCGIIGALITLRRIERTLAFHLGSEMEY
jgi:hypothetical protein